MKWRTAEIFQHALVIRFGRTFYKSGICLSQFGSDVRQRSFKLGSWASPPFSRRLAFRQGLHSLWGFVINLPIIYIIDLCFNLHPLFLSYPQLSFQGSLLPRRQATLKQILYSHHDRCDSLAVIRFLVFKPPLTRRCLHHFYLFPYPHLLQPFLVSAQRDPWSLVLCYFRLLAHTSRPTSPAM